MSRQQQHCSNIISFFLHLFISIYGHYGRGSSQGCFSLHFIHKCVSKSICEYAGILNFLMTVIVSLLNKNNNHSPVVKGFYNWNERSFLKVKIKELAMGFMKKPSPNQTYKL